MNQPKSITLNDGQTHDLEFLLAQAKDDEFYYGYLGKSCLSSSLITSLLSSPKEYYQSINGINENSSALLVGGAIHVSLLEEYKLPQLYTFADVASRNTKAYKELAQTESRKVLTRPEWDLMAAVHSKLTKIDDFVDRLDLSETEVPAVGTIEGIAFRGKADMKDPVRGKVYDLKTTSSIKDFKRSAYKYNYDAQAYIYCTLFDIHYSDFEFLVVDKRTLEFGIFNVSSDAFERGREKVMKGIEVYVDFFHNKGLDEIEEIIDRYVIQDTI